MSLRDRTISAVVWSALGRFASQLVQFFVVIALARLLAPRDFGLLAMLMVFVGLAHLLNELGFGAALVQRRDLEERHLHSVFWVNLGVGAFWTAAAIAAGPLIAGFYDTPVLAPMAALIAVNFLIGAAGVVPSALMQRAMAFRPLAAIALVGTVLGGAVAIVLALRGYGVWSLVWQQVTQAAVQMIGVWWCSDWRPRARFERAAFLEILPYSANLLGFNLANHVIRNVDDLLIGRYLGARDLGLYARAYGTMLMPLGQISAPVGNAMFPAMSRLQDDTARAKSAYLRAVAAIALVTFPMMAGMMIVAEPFVLAVYGEQWRPAIPLLQVFCLLGLVQSIGTTVGWVFTSQGRTDTLLYLGLAIGAATIAAVVTGIVIGTVMAVAICYTVVAVAVEVPSLWLAGRLIGTGLGEILARLRGVVAATALMGGVVAGLGWLVPSDAPAAGTLAVQVAVGVVVYWATVHAMGLEAYRALVEIVRERLDRRSGAAR